MTDPQRRILLVEDEESLAESIRYSLEQDGFTVTLAADGRKAIERFRSDAPDLVILDLMLPELSGLDVCRLIREESNVPIVMVTAKDSEADKVAGLELGADDYVTKPFSMKELLARVNAHLRRAAALETSEDEVYEDAHLWVDRPRHAVVADGEAVHLTKKEFDLLWLLVKSRSRVVSRETILTRLWDYSTDVETRTVDVHIRALRRKLGDQRIETVVGLGYRYREGAAKA